MIRYLLTIVMSLWVIARWPKITQKLMLLETTKLFSTLRSAILAIRKNGL